MSSVPVFVDRHFDIFYRRPILEPNALIQSCGRDVLLQAHEKGLGDLDDWTILALKPKIEEIRLMWQEGGHILSADATQRTTKAYWTVLRWALFRNGHGLTVPEIMYFLGKDETMSRLAEALTICQTPSSTREKV